MTTAPARLYLTKVAALHAVLHKMQEEQAYRPGWSLPGRAGILQAEEYLKDLKQLMEEMKTEGDG